MTPTLTTPRERPILFSGAMVRALLAGRKTMTRRVVKPQPSAVWGHGVPLEHVDKQRRFGIHMRPVKGADLWLPCPYGAPGDRLWVKETFAVYTADEGTSGVLYRADEGPNVKRRWKPGIHMPRWASRITLEVTSVRVERIQEISEEDARAEGVDALTAFECDVADGSDARAKFGGLWRKINGAESWERNEWVWVVSFRRVKP